VNTFTNLISNNSTNLIRQSEKLARLILMLVVTWTGMTLLSSLTANARPAFLPQPTLDHPGFFGFAVETIPILLSPCNSVEGGKQSTILITLQEASASGGSIKVGCDHPELLDSPSGSWPYTLNVPAGSSTVSLTVRTHTVQTSTSVAIYACQTSLDITNPANHQAKDYLTLSPAGTSTP
jgi:hypothetical protein